MRHETFHTTIRWLFPICKPKNIHIHTVCNTHAYISTLLTRQLLLHFLKRFPFPPVFFLASHTPHSTQLWTPSETESFRYVSHVSLLLLLFFLLFIGKQLGIATERKPICFTAALDSFVWVYICSCYHCHHTTILQNSIPTVQPTPEAQFYSRVNHTDRECDISFASLFHSV